MRYRYIGPIFKNLKFVTNEIYNIEISIDMVSSVIDYKIDNKSYFTGEINWSLFKEFFISLEDGREQKLTQLGI